MTKVTATEAARNFSDLLNKIKYQGMTYEVTRGRETVARIIPAGPASTIGVTDLNELFAALPPLQDDEIYAFENDIRAIRNAAEYVERKWD